MKKLATFALALGVFTGIAYAGDPKAGAPAPPPDKKAEKVVAPPKMEMPKPPQEITDMTKAMAGTWKCSGQVDIMGQMVDLKGTVTHKAEYDGWWISSTIAGTAGKFPPMHSGFMTTYDAGAKKFYRMSQNGHGGHAISWGTLAGTTVTWEGDAHWGGNDVKIRGTDEMASPKEAHIVGEASKDGGKTWSKDHDITCKK